MDIGLTNELKRVLLADDNEINAEIAAIQLKDMGLQVDRVSNGRMAVDAFAESSEYYYDAIVMDIMMPVMDGIEAIAEIKKLNREDVRNIPVVAVSANDYPEGCEQLLQNGVSCFITKPYSKSYFQSVVKEQIDGRNCEKDI